MKDISPRPLELLAPAADASVAIEAILHGADAVYIGGPGHGARKAASNSISDISRVTDFAHTYGAKVYVTVNTLLYDDELKKVERMAGELYRAGVDALIVQDMALLRLDIPPIQLHASTQCDIRTPEKALFLEKAGFSQLVLARELTLDEIRAVTEVVSIPVETFVHGALCVSYSGRCHASQSCRSRSANRGECAQICRLPYTLRDAGRRVIERDAHLLSLRDLNATEALPSLVEAGVSSFKIEGRLKETAYVKNITAWYRQRLDAIISMHPDLYRRASYGESCMSFSPVPEKSFNRGFTTYFLSSSRPDSIASLRTPKSMGEVIDDPAVLNRGDGISFFDSDGQYTGVIVNGVEKGRIKGNRPFYLPPGSEIHRTSDVMWQKMMARPSAERRMAVDISVDPGGVSATSESGAYVRLPMPPCNDKARRPMDFRQHFEKLGATPFRLRRFECTLPADAFYPASALASTRRKLTDALLVAERATYAFPKRGKETAGYPYPESTLDFRDNVANAVAKAFYHEHGVSRIEPALELEMRRGCKPEAGRVVMTTRHCILRELGMCLRNSGGRRLELPLTIESGDIRFSLRFNCAECGMEVLKA